MAKCVCGEEKFVLTQKRAEALLQRGGVHVLQCSNCGGDIRGRMVVSFQFVAENDEPFDPAIVI